MKLVVDHIKDAPFVFHVNEPVESFPKLVEMSHDKICCITGNIVGDFTATREYDAIRVIGRVVAPLALVCSRCLTEFTSSAETGFTVYFRNENMETSSVEHELELVEMDLLSSSYSGDEIDFAGEIEEQILMEIPVKPLCSDSCKGLCHECGTDLNVSGCSCVKKPVSLAFGALKNFKVAR